MRNVLANPCLASTVSLLPVVAFLGVLVVCLPRPLPTLIAKFGWFGMSVHALPPAA